MMDHGETATDSVYHMILYNLLCFASVPVFIFGRAARKVARINYQNPITESCHACLDPRPLALPNQNKNIRVCKNIASFTGVLHSSQ